ncbi:glucose-6-phosphate 1-dehydrogenase [Insulibacter thermoxylanivorax]|uniref:Glucose-6-phosphate 1-dehydrogenase n=2 Tax=Insulibacter thermoxylanivorax TaxID=2749268 RepID=A0A916QI94_9BACL|nr:glucose-6-phosphate 1-dehydrogenase [Insulibacter thermoxylanivorax]
MVNENLNGGAVFFIFGATGDLAKRKLFPAIFSLYRERKIGEKFAVIGLARRPKTNEQFRDDVYRSIQEFARYKKIDDVEWTAFAEHFTYMSLDINNLEGFRQLNELTQQVEARFNIAGNRLFYLALAPEHFGTVAEHLKAGGLLETDGWHRLVIEKPFGYDQHSAAVLNEEITSVFKEDEIYRIDHYLGKEMVQNIEVLRFSNALFEPLWNNKYIANVQITMSETVGVEERGAYYEKSGALRDMVQNHMLQMLTMIAMEPPSRLHPEAIRDEKVKVLRSLRRFQSREDVLKHVVRGQYTAGTKDGKAMPAYREEPGVNPASVTDTFFAAKLYVDNFRWAGVPFYIRTGKRLATKSTEVVIEFKNVPERMYFAEKNRLEPNLLVIRVNPMEGIYFKMNAKNPESNNDGQPEVIPVAVDFCQSCRVGYNTPEAYERLLYDAVRGDSTYFTRWDEVSLAWQFIDRIAEAWNEDSSDLTYYPAGSWGPEESHQLLARDGFKWWPVQGQEDDAVIWTVSGSGI